MSTARKLDQFYTSRKVSSVCFDIFLSTVERSPDDWLLEPSAGDGAFLELMIKHAGVGRFIGVDLDPKCFEAIRCDFLTEFKPATVSGKWHVCGNPPFGKNSGLAVRFFNRAAEFAETIAFIVPMTFRKDSIQKRLDGRFHLVSDTELPLDSFVFEGKQYSVPCCFQIWKRQSTPRVHIDQPLTHGDFDFVAPEHADIAFRRIGAVAGKVLTEFQGYSASSHYFLKANVDLDVLVARLSTIDWTDTRCNTAGNPSISKRELVKQYSQIVLNHPAGLSRTIGTGAVRMRRSVTSRSTSGARTTMVPGFVARTMAIGKRCSKGRQEGRRLEGCDARRPMPMGTARQLGAAGSTNAGGVAGRAERQAQKEAGRGPLRSSLPENSTRPP